MARSQRSSCGTQSPTMNTRAATFHFINKDPSIKRILILDEGIAAYFFGKLNVKLFGRRGEKTLGASNVAQVLTQLPNLHVTHILDARDRSSSFRLPDHRAGLTLLFKRGDERVYRIDR